MKTSAPVPGRVFFPQEKLCHRVGDTAGIKLEKSHEWNVGFPRKDTTVIAKQIHDLGSPLGVVGDPLGPGEQEKEERGKQETLALAFDL